MNKTTKHECVLQTVVGNSSRCISENNRINATTSTSCLTNDAEALKYINIYVTTRLQ